MLKFYTPSQLAQYSPPDNAYLVGKHFIRGAVTVLTGAPGVGKSFAARDLAVAGALGGNWFGLKVHEQFKTMIFQGENQLIRLKKEYENLDVENLDEWIRVSGPNLNFYDPTYLRSALDCIEDFKPHCMVFDPWSDIALDDDKASHTVALRQIDKLIFAIDPSPACLIVAHNRKPKSDSKPEGRDLLHELSGSLKLGSRARAVFSIQSVKSDDDKNLVKLTCCKSNDGEMIDPTFWNFEDCEFTRIGDFQETSRPNKSKGITPDQLKDALTPPCQKKEAVKKLMAATGKAASACYKALQQDNDMYKYIEENNGVLSFKAEENYSSEKSLGGNEDKEK